MFERFTDRARRVVVLAQEEARMLGHERIGTEHLLLGFVHEGEGVAARALGRCGVTLEAARERVEVLRPQGAEMQGHIPFTPRAKKSLELGLREALSLGHNYIGTEHLLLGVLREAAGSTEGKAAAVLEAMGVPLEKVRETIMELLHGYQGAVDVSRHAAAEDQFDRLERILTGIERQVSSARDILKAIRAREAS